MTRVPRSGGSANGDIALHGALVAQFAVAPDAQGPSPEVV